MYCILRDDITGLHLVCYIVQVYLPRKTCDTRTVRVLQQHCKTSGKFDTSRPVYVNSK